MLKRLFGRRSSANRIIVDSLYAKIVAAARQPELYSEWHVPDTPLGRFEMVGLHLFLLLHRVRGETGAIRDVAQELTDEFFRDVEHSIRELGISDPGVPKRMKKLARMFYGRVVSYGDAIDADDRQALAEAIARNVRPDVDGWPEADRLTAYVITAAQGLAALTIDAILQGSAEFPSPLSVPGERSA
ncbi:ubiquinol-cytochrome C chaperone family protein [Mesorhizobium sp. 1B3]|uniref:ubiquinol-cytochrome C chaperone family protein n=1 Tax=Mesorhizobium sp. 1B3 TaxID=3243599 RepID=UPI003D97B633